MFLTINFRFLIIDVKHRVARVLARRRATILADYNFCTTSKVDSLYQFVDCADVGAKELCTEM